MLNENFEIAGVIEEIYKIGKEINTVLQVNFLAGPNGQINSKKGPKQSDCNTIENKLKQHRENMQFLYDNLKEWMQ